MRTLIKLEELAMAAAGIYLCTLLSVMPVWWLYALLFFTPDIGMMGYLVNTRVGAVTYNLFHHKGIAIAVWAVGLLLATNTCSLPGCCCLPTPRSTACWVMV